MIVPCALDVYYYYYYLLLETTAWGLSQSMSAFTCNSMSNLLLHLRRDNSKKVQRPSIHPAEQLQATS